MYKPPIADLYAEVPPMVYSVIYRGIRQKSTAAKRKLIDANLHDPIDHAINFLVFVEILEMAQDKINNL